MSIKEAFDNKPGTKDKLECNALKFEESFLPGDTSWKPSKPVIRSQDSMAGNNEWDWVCSTCTTNGTDCSGMSDGIGDLAVGLRLSKKDSPYGSPNVLLKHRSSPEIKTGYRNCTHRFSSQIRLKPLESYLFLWLSWCFRIWFRSRNFLPRKRLGKPQTHQSYGRETGPPDLPFDLEVP